MARKGDLDRMDEPDVEIGVRARARELRFRERPQINVERHGEVIERARARQDVEIASGSERKNLPEEVEPGLTYRDIDIRWRATARLRSWPAERRRRRGA